jgi:acetyl esterase/lipase
MLGPAPEFAAFLRLGNTLAFDRGSALNPAFAVIGGQMLTTFFFIAAKDPAIPAGLDGERRLRRARHEHSNHDHEGASHSHALPRGQTNFKQLLDPYKNACFPSDKRRAHRGFVTLLSSRFYPATIGFLAQLAYYERDEKNNTQGGHSDGR